MAQIPYISANLLMDKWKVYPLDLYTLIIATPDLPAYKITNSAEITRFIPPAKEKIDIEKIVQGLLFKRKDISDIENKYDFDPDKRVTTGTRADSKNFSPEVINMINNARPEVEKLYAAIKRIGFSGRKHNNSECYKEAVTKCFNDNRNDFKLVKESHLTDWSLYTFRGGQEKGDFIGKLLQKISNDLNLNIDNYQELYKIYKSTKRLKKSEK